MSMFASPGAAGGGWSVADAEGHLVVIDVHSHETGIVTSLGDKDAIKATVHDVTDGESYEDTLIFPKVLVGSLKGRIGQKVLGTLGKGVAKPGQNAPWVLFDAAGDPAAVDQATKYLTGQVAETLTAPEPTPAPAPVADPAKGNPVDLTGKTPEQVAALKAMGLA